MKKNYYFVILLTLSMGCGENVAESNNKKIPVEKVNKIISEYNGTGSITYNLANIKRKNIDIDKKNNAPLGVSIGFDGKEWTVPAKTNYKASKLPFSQNLFSADQPNSKSLEEILNAYPKDHIIEINKNGELITALIFAENYSELYINGCEVAKDRTPYNDLNAQIVQFKVKKPFTIACKVVDWEQNIGLGTEVNLDDEEEITKGGFMAVFLNESQEVVAKTDENWKANTYYIGPLEDVNCVKENEVNHISATCPKQIPSEETFALHWDVPSDWSKDLYDDFSWNNASNYTPDQVGVEDTEVYENFKSLLSSINVQPSFIWSSNNMLDNEVILRYKVN